MSFKDDFDKHQEEVNQGSDFFKFKNGENRLRIMSEPVKKVSRFGYGICFPGAPYCNDANLEKEYQQKIEEAESAGKDPKKVSRPSLSKKWSCWAIDRVESEKQNKPVFVIIDLPSTIAKAIREMMDSEEYQFTDFPMPYDITVKAENAGTTAVNYTIMGARTNSEVTEQESEEFAKLTPIDQIIEKMQANQRERYEKGELNNPGEPAGPEGEQVENIEF